MPIQGVFLFNSGGFLDSVLDGIIFVRYCTFIFCGLMNTDEVRVIQKQNIRFVSLMFSRSLGIFYIKCLRRRKTFLATCIFEVIRLQATCFQLIAGSTPSRFLCQWLQAQVLLLEVIIHLLTGASPWLNLYLSILAPSLSYTTKVAVYLLYSRCTFDGLLVLNVLERFS